MIGGSVWRAGMVRHGIDGFQPSKDTTNGCTNIKDVLRSPLNKYKQEPSIMKAYKVKLKSQKIIDAIEQYNNRDNTTVHLHIKPKDKPFKTIIAVSSYAAFVCLEIDKKYEEWDIISVEEIDASDVHIIE